MRNILETKRRCGPNLAETPTRRQSTARNEDLSVTSERLRKLPSDTSECRCCAKMDEKYTRRKINSYRLN